MVRQLGRINDSVIRSAMTQPIFLSHLARNPSMGPSNVTQDFQNNLEFDRRTPKERFFDSITVVNSNSFLPQIPNKLTSQTAPLLVGTSSPLQKVFCFGKEDSNAELLARSSVNGSHSVNGSASEQCPTQSHESAASVDSLQRSISRQESDSVPSDTLSRSLQHSVSRQESDSVVSSVPMNDQGTPEVLGTSPARESSHDITAEDILKAAPCLTSSPIKNLAKRRKSGKKKHKSTTGRQRSTGRKSKHSEQKQGNVAVSNVEKKLIQKGNTANLSKDSKVRIKLKLSSGSTKRLTNIGAAYSVDASPPMGQRVSRVIKPHDGAKDTAAGNHDEMNLLSLYSQPIQVSQKQKLTKKTVTLPTPIFAPKPPKTRNNVQSYAEIDVNVPTRRQSVGGSLDVGDYVPYRPAEEQYAATRGLVRVYLSERQSGMIKLHGQLHPGAPPATPTPAQLSHVVYIPSMNDIKAQRELKMRLEVLDRQDKKRQEKRVEENLRKEMSAQKERVKALKTMQRLQIYALNEVMTTLENDRYEKFKQQKQKHLEKDLKDIR